MKKGYHIDLGRISLDDLQRTLTTGYVLPSRQVLKEDILNRFDIIRSMGITDLESLLDRLKNKQMVEDFGKRSGLPADYLTILRREVNGYLSKPVAYSRIPGIDGETLKALEMAGIRNTRQMFERGITRSDRSDIAGEIGVPESIVVELVKMADISRIMGVGPVFSRTILNSGVDTVEKISKSDPDIFFRRMAELYKEQGFDKVDFVLRDIQWCIDMAKRLPKTIEW